MPAGDQVVPEPPPMPQPRRFDEDGDATRRTWMASERTVLAWVRTGMTSTAVAVAVGKVLPELHDGGTWEFAVLGVGYAVLGFLATAYGLWRGREVDRAIRGGEWVRPDDRALWLMGGLAMLLSLVAVVVVIS